MHSLSQTAIVILNYNGRDFLRQFLPGVVQHSRGAQVVVADNGSTDDSLAVIKAEFPGVAVVAMPENRGFCGGYNLALSQVQAAYYVLLNSDVEVTETWLAPMVDLLDREPGVAAVQPKVLSWHQRDTFEYAGAAGGFIDALGYPFCRGRIFDTVEKDIKQYDDERPIFWATGACLTIRASVFHGMGGFDEDFFAHMEEIDLCWKIHRNGGRVYYTGASTVYHIGGGTLSKLSPRKTYLNFRNGLTLIFKNMRAGELIWKLPLRIVLDWAALGTFLWKGSGGNAWAVVKAHAHFLVELPSAMRKRILYKHLSVNGLKRGIAYPGSLIAAYYLKGKKRFTDLKF